MCVTCKNISLFVDWLTELTAYSDSIVVFPLSFTFSSSVTQFLTQSQPLRKSDATLASHITLLFIQLETVTVGHNEQRARQKKTNHTHNLSLHHTHLQHTQSSVCNLNPLPVQQFGFLRLRGPFKHNTQVHGLQECFAPPALTHSLSL